jgi:DNA (cytosine-5)-methyltransferase 1
MWPTPKSNDAEKRGNFDASHPRNGLPAAVKRIPTPTASDWKGSSKPGQRRGQLTYPNMGVIEAGGQLNPEWVELLMGWPKGWTRLGPMDGKMEPQGSLMELPPVRTASKPSATAKCHNAPQKHGGS